MHLLRVTDHDTNSPIWIRGASIQHVLVPAGRAYTEVSTIVQIQNLDTKIFTVIAYRVKESPETIVEALEKIAVNDR
jgi:hypothetical protein